MIIYILELNNSKYCIGKTDNFENRLQQHISKKGSKWTKKYKFIKLIDKINSNDSFDEMKYTLIYMSKYGIENVRGGPWCEINLDKEEIKYINKYINSLEDKCYICGSTNHISKNCKERGWECEKCGKKFKKKKNAIIHEKKCNIWECEKCGKNFKSYNHAVNHEKLCKKII